MDLPRIEQASRTDPLIIPWPTYGNPNGLIQFDQQEEWRAFIAGLDIDPRIPDIVRVKYIRAQKLYLLGWIDVDLIKAGELVALTTLELALTDRYGARFKTRNRTFAALLKHLVEVDGLTDEQMPMVARYGGTVIGQLLGTTRPTLAQRRNAMAHGDPFDGLPVVGLLELVRDLITFAYRQFLTGHHANIPPMHR